MLRKVRCFNGWVAPGNQLFEFAARSTTLPLADFFRFLSCSATRKEQSLYNKVPFSIQEKINKIIPQPFGWGMIAYSFAAFFISL